MGLIELLLTLALVGLITWAIVRFVPMPEAMKTIIVAVACIVVILWLIKIFGFDLPVPRAR